MDHLDGIASLPEQMAEVAIGADFLAHGLAQLHQRTWIVDDKIGMHLKRQPTYAMLPCEFCRLPPVGNHLLFPLPVLHLRVFGRPTIGDPVRLRVIRSAPGAAGKSYDDADVEALREKYGPLEAFVIAHRMFCVGVNRIAVATKSSDANAAVFKFLFPGFGFRGISQEFLHRTVLRAGVAARADFHGLKT